MNTIEEEEEEEEEEMMQCSMFNFFFFFWSSFFFVQRKMEWETWKPLSSHTSGLRLYFSYSSLEIQKFILFCYCVKNSQITVVLSFYSPIKAQQPGQYNLL